MWEIDEGDLGRFGYHVGQVPKQVIATLDRFEIYGLCTSKWKRSRYIAANDLTRRRFTSGADAGRDCSIDMKVSRRCHS